MSARLIPDIKANIRIQYRETATDSGAFVFQFTQLSDRAIEDLGCRPFARETGNPIVELVTAPISREAVFAARRSLIDSLDLLERDWADRNGVKDLSARIERVKIAGDACFNKLVRLHVGDIRQPPGSMSHFNLAKTLRQMFTHVARTSIDQPPIIVIEGAVASNVPWQVFPLVDLAHCESADFVEPFSKFLAANFVIQRRHQQAHAGERESLQIANGRTPMRMKFFQNRSLTACRIESDFLCQVQSENGIDLQGTPWPKDKREPHEFVRLATDHRTVVASDGTITDGDNDHVHHYSCHHEFDAPDDLPPQSTIWLQGENPADRLKVTAEEIEAELQNAYTGSLLAFFNACKTGRDADGHNELGGLRGWMLNVLDFAAVIASETNLKDSSCGELSISFYRHFLRGEDAAHALFRAIREAVLRSDPTCLLIALHGDGRVRLQKPHQQLSA